MMRNYFAGLTSVGGGVVPPTPANYVNVAMIMGQSNIDGRNDIINLPGDISNPSAVVKIYDAGSFIDWDCTSPPTSDDVRQTYAADTICMNRLAGNLSETIYTIKRSQGGSAFKLIAGDNWNVNYRNSLYDEFVSRITATKNLIESLGLVFNPIYLWCDIGESDSATSDKTTFKKDYKDFINAIRTLVNNPVLPVIHRKLQLDQDSVHQWFLDAQEEFVAGEINNYTLIRDIYTLQDSVHLDSASSESYADTVRNVVINYY